MVCLGLFEESELLITILREQARLNRGNFLGGTLGLDEEPTFRFPFFEAGSSSELGSSTLTQPYSDSLKPRFYRRQPPFIP